ncbi:hypothetical protein POL68_17025 [Stigmatella sp. ncwal1]|uniref:MetA-pathway of phenol degradation n=1 Tax=Stigmatella ashevillensis TaxID=2995309 RepID=A0ABT5D934_9BACT|nr:hypothetical protein [Stigmatella ashevillena]MDC0710183.1 hypothetical protein [Stigmatella ashevillena]
MNSGTNGPVYAIVRDQYTIDLMGALSLLGRFELGMALPITSHHSAPSVSLPPRYPRGVHTTDVGDLRLVPKLQLLSTSVGLRLGVAVPLLLPTSGGKEFLGRDDIAVFPRLLGEWTQTGGVRVLTNVGVNFQPRKQLYNLNVGNELAYGLGAEVPFQLGKHQLAAEATLVGAIGLQETDPEECPLELLASLKHRLTNGFEVHLGGGPGITHGYGTPSFRLFVGLLWTGNGARFHRPRRAAPAPSSS